jgi:hypothetical protein
MAAILPNQEQPPHYSLAERDRRWTLARQIMDAEEVDALLVHPRRLTARGCGNNGYRPEPMRKQIPARRV